MRQTQVGPVRAALVPTGGAPYIPAVVHRMLQEATMPNIVSRSSIMRDPNSAMTLAQSDILAPAILAIVSFLAFGFGRVARLFSRG